jgi:magnesium-transporting ATPase (P-type)
VASGQGTGVVVATGRDTELGRISGLLAGVAVLRTPLLEEVDRFARRVSLAVLVLGLATFAFGWGLRGYGVGEMFLVTVGMAVAAIPEGLPAILSITLAIGVRRMAGRNAIIRRLPAVDTLGAVDVICTDKTGTLTRNEMMITDLRLPGGALTVDGSGYAPIGGFQRDGAVAPPDSIGGLEDLARCAVLCNDAHLDHRDGAWRPVGDPIEGALLALAGKAGLNAQVESAERPRADVLPFESEHRFMATLHHVHGGGALVLLKGAPEVVIGRCVTAGAQPIDRESWMVQVEQLARQGRRVLALAARSLPEAPTELTFAGTAAGFDLLGLVGAIDPPRDEAIAAVAECQQAGIRVKMITGDHAATAEAIARDLGIGQGQPALTGTAIDALDEAGLARAVEVSDVFARVSPEHKLRIVQALQANGRTIAMTGDGVNDAPALKRAHIGIAMGERGTEVAKQAADMVLADDNFASIAVAVREGRTVFDNLRKAILFILPTNGGQALVILAALLSGLTLPLTPVQILWVNLVTAVTLALALGFEPAEHDLMRRPPRPTHASLLPALFIWRLVLVSVLMSAGALGIFTWLEMAGRPLEEARTAAVTTLVAIETLYLLNTRSIIGPVVGRRRPPSNRWVWSAIGTMIVLQALYIYLPWSQRWFHTAPPDGATWVAILAIAGAIFIAVEVEKALLRTRRRHW